jgi:hypothetical protein
MIGQNKKFPPELLGNTTIKAALGLISMPFWGKG